jgi:nucleoside-diphosphate-sugar epimerase
MKAIVTGGAGFVGSHLVEALLARGDDVLCIERPGAQRYWLEGLPVGWSEAGIGDERRLAELFAGTDVVFHLAALTEARSSAQFDEVNTEGTARVLRGALATSPRPPRVVFMSTLAALGPCRNGDALDADSVPHPLSAYGRSKLMAEAVVHAYRDRVPAVILRFPSIYGPRERAVLRLFQMVTRGVAVTVGGWDREVSLIYVADAVHALIAAAVDPHAEGKTFCVAHPRPVTWRGFALEVGKAMGRVPRLVSIPVPAARGAAWAFEECARLRGRAAVLNRDRVRELIQERWVCDPRPAMDEIGFRPRFAVGRGVVKTASWYREAGWL